MQMSKWLLLLLTLPATAFAQQQKKTTTANGRPIIMDLSPKISDGCPVGLVAKRQGIGPTMWTIAQEDAASPWPGARPRPNEVGVQVQLSSLYNLMKQVDLSVEYVPYGVHYTPLQQSHSGPPNPSKTFQLVADGDAATHIGGNLLVGIASGVVRVHVTHVVYTDGKEWTAPNAASCSVAPNGFILVDGAK